jgi:hypothetical protein
MITICLRHGLILSHIQQVQFLARCLHLRCPQVELDDLRVRRHDLPYPCR